MIRDLLLHRKDQERTALIENGREVSYRTLTEKAAAVRQLFHSTETENIAVFLPDGEAFIAAFFGILMAGMTVFPLSTKLTKYEILPLLDQADVHTILTTASYGSLFEELSREFPGRFRIRYIGECTALSHRDIPAAVKAGIHEPMLLLGTSGTTGNAKIVQLSESNLSYCVLSYLSKMDYEKYASGTIRYFIAAPYSSVYGLLILAACITKGFPIVCLQEPFSLDVLYKAAEQYRVTHYEGGVIAAVLMDQLAGREIPYDIRSFRYFGLAGSKVSPAILHRLSKAFPSIEFWTGYGMTEASPLIAKPYKKMDPEKFASVGTALEGETLLVEADGQKTAMPYIRGEILVKGPNVMLGYCNNQKETEKILKNGFLYTGDIGYLDDDGYLYICGRKKNVIIVRGFNVYAEEVEACLMNCPLVKDCIVYGESDGQGNERVCADIVPIVHDPEAEAGPSIEELHTYISAHLSDYKQPQIIRLLDRIEKTATGKSKKTGETDYGAD